MCNQLNKREIGLNQDILLNYNNTLRPNFKKNRCKIENVAFLAKSFEMYIEYKF